VTDTKIVRSFALLRVCSWFVQVAVTAHWRILSRLHREGRRFEPVTAHHPEIRRNPTHFPASAQPQSAVYMPE
jgi:hypothetical protein